MKKADFKKLKKYSQTSGRSAIDWEKRLKEKKVTMAEWRNRAMDSQDWVTCACGNTCSIIPRDHSGRPDDPILNELGKVFHSQILNRNARKALNVLAKIEKRSIILIKQELKKVEDIGFKFCGVK